MRLFVLFLLIVGGKVLLAKGISLVLVLLSFAIKGQSLKKDEIKFDDYLISLTDKFVNKYVFCIYIVSTLLSSLVAYFMFNAFKFEYPILTTVILTLVCMLISLIKYRKKGKEKISGAFYKLHHPEEDNEDNEESKKKMQ